MLWCHQHESASDAALQEDWPVLVVVPASLRLAWAEELERWLPHLRPCEIRVIESSNNKLKPQDSPQVIQCCDYAQRPC